MTVFRSLTQISIDRQICFLNMEMRRERTSDMNIIIALRKQLTDKLTLLGIFFLD
jgi:hypothetical protein